LGREMLSRELKKRRVAVPPESELDDLAMALSYSGREMMLAGIAEGALSLSHVINKLAPAPEKTTPKSIVGRFIDRARGTSGVRIQNMGQMMFRFAGCCQPVPGEQVIGYITRGRGITVHRADCPNALALADQPERRVQVDWDVERGGSFLVQLTLVIEHRRNMLNDITNAISELDTNVRLAEISGDTQTGYGRFVIEVTNIKHLRRVMSKVKAVKGVLSVERTRGLDADLRTDDEATGE
jgi:guanosine-3',5'-bis(diphosphate) 3'-pyrophosphohydrolase